MRADVIVFSQTGNTWRVAEAIGAGLGAAGVACRLRRLEQTSPAELGEAPLLGFGCPVFYYQEPLNVRRFLEALPPLDGRAGFVFCTHGAVMGTTLEAMAARLKDRGLRLLGAFDAYADAFLPFYPHPTYTTGHPDAQELARAERFGAAMAAAAAARPAVEAPLEPVPDDWRRYAATFTPESLAAMFPPLVLDREACTGCRECERGCPVGGIAIDADPPRLQSPCIWCWRCVNACPEAAIGADWSAMVALAPRLYRRYRRWLEKAAAAGRFRWHVDPEAVRFDAPLALQRRRAAGRPR